MIFRHCSDSKQVTVKGIYLSPAGGAKLPTANSYTAPHFTQAPDRIAHRGLVVCIKVFCD